MDEVRQCEPCSYGTFDCARPPNARAEADEQSFDSGTPQIVEIRARPDHRQPAYRMIAVLGEVVEESDEFDIEY